MNRLKELRKEKKYTLDDIAKATGIKRGTYNNYENNKTEPKLATWQKLADFFNVPISYLQGFDSFSSEGISLLIEKLTLLSEMDNRENTSIIEGMILITNLLYSYGQSDSVKALDSFFDNLLHLDPDNPGIDLIVSEQSKKNFEYKYLSTGGFLSTKELKSDTSEKANKFIDNLAKLQEQQNKKAH